MNTTEEFLRLQKETLEGMKKRRDLLSQSIARLEASIAQVEEGRQAYPDKEGES